MKTIEACAVAAVMGASVFAKPAFYLPETIYAAPGTELNVYYKEVFDSVTPWIYAYQCECRKGKTELKRWCWTPKAEDAGKSYRLVVNAWNDDGLVASATTAVAVAAAPVDPKRKLTLALFADSLTNCRYQDRVFSVMTNAGYSCYLPVGSHGTNVKHDGYGGYTCNAFLNHYSISEEEFDHVQDQAEREQLKALGVPVKIIHQWQKDLLRSPLIQFRDGKKVVDVPHWLGRVNGGQAPDVVVVELGVNDVFGYKGEAEALRARMRKELMPTFTKFIAALRPHMPRTRFAITTQPVGTNQDGFGFNYASSWNEVQHRKIMFALNRELDAYVKSLHDPLVELLPLGHAVDPDDGYVYHDETLSAVSKTKIRRNCNAVHPNDVGGLQMGDTISAWLRARWNEMGK